MSPPVYLIIRLLIWIASFGICIFPVLMDIDRLSFEPLKLAWQANLKGSFRDLYFAIVPTSTLAIATLIDFMINHYSEASEDFKGATIICLILNIVALVSGFVGFLFIPSNHSCLEAASFYKYWWIFNFAIILSFVTEAIMALVIRSHR